MKTSQRVQLNVKISTLFSPVGSLLPAFHLWTQTLDFEWADGSSKNPKPRSCRVNILVILNLPVSKSITRITQIFYVLYRLEESKLSVLPPLRQIGRTSQNLNRNFLEEVKKWTGSNGRKLESATMNFTSEFYFRDFRHSCIVVEFREDIRKE